MYNKGVNIYIKGDMFMKKIMSIILCIAILFTVPITAFAAEGVTYYIDSTNGDDSASGNSPSSAWKTTANIETLDLQAGDKVLFKRDGIYECAIELTCSGTEENPILISAYGEGARPILMTNEHDAVMKLFDCDYVTVSELEMTAHNGGGIWVDGVTKASYGVTVENVIMHDMQNYKVTTRDNFTNGPISGRAGIVIKRYGSSAYPVNDFKAINCEIYDTGNGIFVTGQPELCKNLLIEGCYFHDMDAEAVVIEGCDGALVDNCRAINCCQGEGVDENGEILYYIAAMWFHYSKNSTFRNCEIAGQRNIGDGMTVDFDHHSYGCTYEYIYSHDNMRFMVDNSKEDAPNYDNTVRFCLSVNDNVAGSNNNFSNDNVEYNLKFHNNTIIGSCDFSFRHSQNSLIANNIFVFQDNRRIEFNRDELKDLTTTFTNNCYYNIKNPIVEKDALNLDPGFASDDINDPNSFKLSKSSPLIGAGIEVEGSEKDFYGNSIESNNIGCYCGTGTDTEYEEESGFKAFFRRFKYIFDYVFRYLSDEFRRLSKKFLKWLGLR